MRSRLVLGFSLSVLVGIGLLVWTGCGQEHDHSAHKHGASEAPASDKAATQEPAAKAYPLKICVVSGEELGKSNRPADPGGRTGT